MLQKVVYLFEYIDDLENLGEPSLHPKRSFTVTWTYKILLITILIMKKKVWKEFGMKNLQSLTECLKTFNVLA